MRQQLVRKHWETGTSLPAAAVRHLQMPSVGPVPMPGWLLRRGSGIDAFGVSPKVITLTLAGTQFGAQDAFVSATKCVFVMLSTDPI